MITQHPSSLLQTLQPVIERHELKYMIPHRLIEPISAFLEPYCALDAHSVSQPGYFYPVNSLYFDTRGLRFLQQRMGGVDRRFNMRVRSYGNGEAPPYYAEVKYKTPTSVKKFRATFDDLRWLEQIKDGGRSPDPDWASSSARTTGSKEGLSRELFLRLAAAYAIEPKMFTCYRRRAFFSTIDEYARVTMDIEMRFRPQELRYSTDPYSLRPDADCQNYDAQTIYGSEQFDPVDVVLECKAAIGAVPVWMLELIRRFELKQVGFSKYMQSSLMHHFDGGYRPMSGDRQAQLGYRF